jgi:Spy/CpxP family protein refolding chaperone
MSKKIIVLVIMGLMLVSMSLTLESAPRQRKMMRHTGFGLMMAEKNLFPAFMLLKFKDEIGLTEAQIDKLEKMQQSSQEARIKKQADIKIQELRMKAYLKEDNIDRGKMEKMLRGIAKMRTDSQVDYINHLLDIKNVLTPEQMKKLEEIKKERMRDRMKRRDKRSKDRGMKFKERMERRADRIEE